MLIKNVIIENNKKTTDIRIIDGKFSEINANIQPKDNEEVLNCTNKLVIPPFVESHVHLDTCLSITKTGENHSGTLFEGIKVWSDFRGNITKEELKSRAKKTIELYVKNGVQYIRSHVDVTSDNFHTLEALMELREEMSDKVTIQLVAFPQDGVLSSPNAKHNISEAIKMGVDVIGGIPHFEFTREYGVESINYIIELATKHNLLVDMHCDEIDDEQSRFIEVLAARAYESGLKNMVSASHATAMHSYNNAYTSKLFRILGLSNINIITNPLVNVNLQGRFDSYPKRRGITRIKELLDSGINVSVGNDDIMDPFYPLGNGNMTDALLMGLHLDHMTGYDDLINSYKMITYNAAKTLNIKDYGIKVGNTANILVLDAADFVSYLRDKKGVAYSIKSGKVIKKMI